MTIAELLLSSGANVDAMTAYYRTPLHWAAINGTDKNLSKEILISYCNYN